MVFTSQTNVNNFSLPFSPKNGMDINKCARCPRVAKQYFTPVRARKLQFLQYRVVQTRVLYKTQCEKSTPNIYFDATKNFFLFCEFEHFTT